MTKISRDEAVMSHGVVVKDWAAGSKWVSPNNTKHVVQQVIGYTNPLVILKCEEDGTVGAVLWGNMGKWKLLPKDNGVQ